MSENKDCSKSEVKDQIKNKKPENTIEVKSRKMTRIRLSSTGNEENMKKGVGSLELPSACPRKSGNVIMWINAGGMQMKQRVVLRLYKSYFDCYAVVSQDKVLCKDCGYISLKNSTCVVSKSQANTFQIIPKNKEGQSLIFTVQNANELNSWMEELNEISGQCESGKDSDKSPRRVLAPISPRMRHAQTKTPLLPALEESLLESEE